MSNTKIFGANHGIATSVAIPDNNSTALDIESTDAKDYITANTTDGSESITLGQATKITGPVEPLGFQFRPQTAHYLLRTARATVILPALSISTATAQTAHRFDLEKLIQNTVQLSVLMQAFLLRPKAATSQSFLCPMGQEMWASVNQTPIVTGPLQTA